MAIRHFTDNDFASLHNYFSGFTPADSTLYEKAQFLATKCNIKNKQWQPAIGWYEARIAEPPSYPDSIFAVIDLGDIHLMMEADNENIELKSRPVVVTPLRFKLISGQISNFNISNNSFI